MSKRSSAILMLDQNLELFTIKLVWFTEILSKINAHDVCCCWTDKTESIHKKIDFAAWNYTLVGTHDLRTLWSPSVSLNQERDTQRHKEVFFLFIIYCFWKVPHEIRCWPTSLLQHFSSLNSLSPQGFVLFTILTFKQPLPSGAKQATYTTHSWDFHPRHRCPPLSNTHNSFTPGFVTALGGAGLDPVGLLWRIWPSTPRDEPHRWKSGSAGPGPIDLLWRTWAPSQTNVVNLYIRLCIFPEQ